MEEFKIEEYVPPTTKIPFQSDKEYHVFLSFRGEDVRKNLVDHLYQALTAAGLHVYKDDDKLEKGDLIWPSLERAIESSAVLIPVFSRGYAESTWCLNEAATMVKTKGFIIPLFYDVGPTHVRYPLGNSSPYKQAFLKHYSHSDQIQREEIEWWKYALQQICPCLKLYGHSVRYPREEIDGWKGALEKICSRSGWSMDLTGGCSFQAQLVKTVVNDVIKTLDKVPLEVAKHPVGLESVTDDLIQKFKLNSKEGVVKAGLCGIGGIGKTTVAKALYNQVYTQFDAASFVFNVRTTAADKTGLTDLQKQILRDLSNYNENVQSVDKGISLFRDRLGGKRVLLILDDVDAEVQSNALVGDWLAPGSRVIITSRDKHMLHFARVSSECIHEMSGLQINEGLKLFSWHAFLRESPIPTHEDLSKRIVEACKGHPLSLEVIGAFLYDKHNEIDCWTEAVDNITLHADIHKTLYISYSALSEEEKEIFLDIACFFIGEHKKIPIIFWKSLYRRVHAAISNLSLKLLIKIDEKGVFDMHDHLQDMGRTIAEEEKQGTRLWETAHLSTASNIINFSRIRLNGGNLARLETVNRPGLRFLHLKNLFIDTLPMLPSSLIWLQLEKCSFAIQETFQFSVVGDILQMRIMQVHGGNISLDSDMIGNLSQLQYLGLGGCINLNNLPDIIGNLSQLQHLGLGGCTNLNNLPDTIGNLSQLQYLALGGCTNLNNLPDTIGNLSQLQHLGLGGCRNLNNLPDTIGNLSQLQHLALGGCTNVNNLPDTIGNLSQLQHLALGGCTNLNNLPDTIGNLSQLQRLDLGGCRNLNNLPDTIGNLSQLQRLGLGGCRNLNNLPDTIGNLSQLQRLGLGGCTNLNNLPDTIGNLSQLQRLGLGGCTNLNNLPDTIGNLSQLQGLGLGGCTNLNNLPDTIGNLSQLQCLGLGVCTNLNNLPDTIGNLSQLQHLGLPECTNLNNLPDTIANLSQLQHLGLGGCTNFNNLLDTIANLSQLQHLGLGGCTNLNNLPDTIANLSQLQHLGLGTCTNLNNLPDTIGNLSQLQHLDLGMCTNLNNLPDTIGNLSQLQHLALGGCRNLNNLPDTIGNLSQLQVLDLGGCTNLNNIPDTIGNLSQLQHLDLMTCPNLYNLPETVGNLRILSRRRLQILGRRRLRREGAQLVGREIEVRDALKFGSSEMCFNDDQRLSEASSVVRARRKRKRRF
ncbi:disease resistance protein RPV1 isoform X1 [Cryptomeria japonica]|uniref:disease resistance protein RPV1 isoform X1 n=1 Tax=Cryptomeria japonica TaxID=3369 RepID=UPI0027D9D900|nr:disease resistance protein RPV1 isoform X1 [Cryptomeria japonica]XP_059068039.1 disease resistance protein RPV1 isoform X1 [Cryptomeria japonica]XP_059068040.1 disease resistance protein RPV1 isoform X1 [Cryptomeria japonica]XP_059068041.1 disease resistance protein RPV1 isoform X1 [Cryptomeria japonica]XP_059068042.1 disease resistance protein RPV1 isoform X1 [Cryptomeria japonica]XP_059068043.1 disease resistance protein RPV1 isoform X1 [Cryptomeria japonica]XP_059068044.1 disease resist